MKILHYSGTGNSAHVARRLAARLGLAKVDLNALLREGHSTDLDDQELIIVSPTYCWRLPRVISDWMEHQTFLPGTRAWFLITCGDDFGNAVHYLKKTCRHCGIECMGGMEVVMPENYITMFRAPSEELSRTIVECAELMTEEAALYIERREAFPEREVNIRDRLFSGPINALFFKFIVKDHKFRVLDSCVGCGLCTEQCPMCNITLLNGRPHWQGHCTHCMACIAQCPQQAIEYGRTTVGKRRHFLEY